MKSDYHRPRTRGELKDKAESDWEAIWLSDDNEIELVATGKTPENALKNVCKKISIHIKRQIRECEKDMSNISKSVKTLKKDLGIG